MGPSPQVPVMGGGSVEGTEDLLTCTTRTRLSGYLVKTAEKASTGSRSTVESRAARADTVRWGCWWPWGYEGHEEKQGQGLCFPTLPDTSVLRECRQDQRLGSPLQSSPLVVAFYLSLFTQSGHSQ